MPSPGSINEALSRPESSAVPAWRSADGAAAEAARHCCCCCCCSRQPAIVAALRPVNSTCTRCEIERRPWVWPQAAVVECVARIARLRVGRVKWCPVECMQRKDLVVCAWRGSDPMGGGSAGAVQLCGIPRCCSPSQRAQSRLLSLAEECNLFYMNQTNTGCIINTRRCTVAQQRPPQTRAGQDGGDNRWQSAGETSGSGRCPHAMPRIQTVLNFCTCVCQKRED
jgi:hypothetical protein